MEHKARNIDRLWVDKDSAIVVRKWTDDEYATVNPETHIYEKHWSYFCPRCRTIPLICADKNDAKHYAKRHKQFCGPRHSCVVKYRDHELVCLEFKEEYSEQFDVWVAKQELY